MRITHVLRGEDLLSSTPRQIPLHRALVDLGIGEAVAAVRPPAVRDGGGQQEALQARPRVAPERLRRAGLPARGPAELPRAAGLVDRCRPRRLHARGDGGGLRHQGRQPQPGALRPQEVRGDQRRPHAAAQHRGARAAAAAVPPRGRPDRGPAHPGRDPEDHRGLRARSTSGSARWPRAPTCSPSSSSTTSSTTRPTSPRCSTPTGSRSSPPRGRRSSGVGELDHRRDRGGAAHLAGRRARAQAARRLRAGARRGHRSPDLAAALRVAGAARARGVAGAARRRAAAPGAARGS